VSLPKILLLGAACNGMRLFQGDVYAKEGIKMPYVLYEKKNRIAYITLNRPERLNALGAELSQQL